MEEMLTDMGFDPEMIKTAIANIGTESSQNIDNILAEIERIQDLPKEDQKTTKEKEDSVKTPTDPIDPKQTALARHEANLKASQAEAAERKRKHEEIEKKAEAARNARIEREKQEKIEAEKNRRKQGTKMQEDQKVFEDQEIRKRQAKMKMERDEDKKAKDKIKRQLAEDRANRAAAREREIAERKAEKEGKTVKAQSATENNPPPSSTTSSKSNSPTTRIQIRLPNNKRLQNTFNSNESFSAVRLYIQINAGIELSVNDEIIISTPYPRKTFTDEDFEKPLSVLGLVPSASLMVEIKRAAAASQSFNSQDQVIDQIFRNNNLN